MEHDPDYGILDRPWTWSIEAVAWAAANEWHEAVLDVTFVRGAERRELRFVDPREIELELPSSYPVQCGEMAILNVSRRQLEGIVVQVTEFGASGTPLRLYARTVIERNRDAKRDEQGDAPKPPTAAC